MRIALMALGSLGDVYPFIALGQGLQAAGHDVLLVTHATFETLVRERGLAFAPVAFNPQDVLKDEAGQSWLAAGGNALHFFRQFRRIAEMVARQSTVDCWRACQDVDALVYSTMALSFAYPIAQKLGIPSCMVAMYPLTPTRAFASPYFPAALSWLPFGKGVYNRLTHTLTIQVFCRLLHSAANKALGEIVGLPPFSSQWLPRQIRQGRIMTLYAYSPSVIPPPADWTDWSHVTGYLFLPRQEGWQAPADLLDFLAAGPPPIYIGFGSMNDRDPEAVTTMMLSVLERTKQRGVLLTGWGGLSNATLPDYVFKLDSIPHDWLFPHMAAVIHHGGSGTTGAAIRAGVPSIITPFFGDQPFWGRRVFELGIGPQPIPRKQLSADRLVAAINAVTHDEAMHQRASTLGERVRAEDGVARAVEVLQKHFALDRKGVLPSKEHIID